MILNNFPSKNRALKVNFILIDTKINVSGAGISLRLKTVVF